MACVRPTSDRLAPPQFVAAEFTVVIGVQTIHQLPERGDKLLGSDDRIAVVVEGLEAVDHLTTHGIQPQGLILLQGKLAIFIGIKAGETVPAYLVDFGLGQLAIVIVIKTFQYALTA
jgi:hypothetical protein